MSLLKHTRGVCVEEPQWLLEMYQILQKYTFNVSSCIRLGIYLYQLSQSLVEVQLLALDRSHCSVWEECAIEMLRRINIFAVWREREREMPPCQCIMPGCVWCGPLRCKMSHSFDVSNTQNVFDRSGGAAEGWVGGTVQCVFVFGSRSLLTPVWSPPSKRRYTLPCPLTRTHAALH